jgi:hypothetical protein
MPNIKLLKIEVANIYNTGIKDKLERLERRRITSYHCDFADIYLHKDYICIISVSKQIHIHLNRDGRPIKRSTSGIYTTPYTVNSLHKALKLLRALVLDMI